MTPKEFDELVVKIKQTKFYEKFVYHHHWISGSLTVVYPIQIWDDRQELEFQLNDRNWRGRIQCINALIKSINEQHPVKNWYVRKSDGSCPSTLNIFFN